MERRRQLAVAAGAERRARGFASSLEQLARDGVVLAAAISERGQDLTRPGTRATRTAVGLAGRRPEAVLHDVPRRHAPLRGRHLRRRRGHRPLRVRDGADRRARRRRARRLGRARHARLRQQLGLAGGRRAPGVRRSRRLPRGRRRCRTSSATSSSGLFHAAASLGIAESADASARRGLAGRINGDARPRMQVADNAIDLAASRGVLSRAAALIDEHRAANPASDGSADELRALFAEAQAAKAFVNEAAARIVDRALAPLGRRRLRQRQPARARVPRRPGRHVHAPARRQSRLRLPRPRRARRADAAPLTMALRARDPGRAGARRARRSAPRSARFATGVAFVTAAPGRRARRARS